VKRTAAVPVGGLGDVVKFQEGWCPARELDHDKLGSSCANRGTAGRALLVYAEEGARSFPAHRNFDDASVVGSTELQTEVMRGFIMGGGLA
jgi:hypothetical protein